ncbi:MAG: hypothetical protein AAGN82_25750 [Myxococcota bacterium]
MPNDATEPPDSLQRPSASADASLRAQIERERAMTPKQRMALALALYRRRGSVVVTPRPPSDRP